MFKTTILETHRGLLFKDGKAIALLDPGVHSYFELFSRYSIELIDLDKGYARLTPELAKVMPADLGTELVVEHGEVGLVFVDGRPRAFLLPDRYVLFQARAHVTALVKSTADVVADVPQAFWPFASATHLLAAVVAQNERGLLYVNGELVRVLVPGAYAFHKEDRSVNLVKVEMRERELTIAGQEVMTKDRVTLRMNVAVKLRVVDAAKSVEAVHSADPAVYSEAQLVVRRFVASHTVDELLEARLEAQSTMTAELHARSREWGLEVRAIDLKDIVLPGEMKTIMNRVVEASKQAEANNIMRREETAATRSLANTAKMLQENPMLLRLKELESYKELAREIDQLTLVVSPNEVLPSLRLTK